MRCPDPELCAGDVLVCCFKFKFNFLAKITNLPFSAKAISGESPRTGSRRSLSGRLVAHRCIVCWRCFANLKTVYISEENCSLIPWSMLARCWRLLRAREHDVSDWTYSNLRVQPRAMTNRAQHPNDPIIAAVRTEQMSNFELQNLNNTSSLICKWAGTLIWSIDAVIKSVAKLIFRDAVRNACICSSAEKGTMAAYSALKMNKIELK